MGGTCPCHQSGGGTLIIGQEGAWLKVGFGEKFRNLGGRRKACLILRTQPSSPERERGEDLGKMRRNGLLPKKDRWKGASASHVIQRGYGEEYRGKERSGLKLFGDEREKKQEFFRLQKDGIGTRRRRGNPHSGSCLSRR